jgi:hypothetical protein
MHRSGAWSLHDICTDCCCLLLSATVYFNDRFMIDKQIFERSISQFLQVLSQDSLNVSFEASHASPASVKSANRCFWCQVVVRGEKEPGVSIGWLFLNEPTQASRMSKST